jgi:3-isopropylmalate/(R)-2-methylmalate dehydratase small subunit
MALAEIRRVEGKAVYLPGDDIDTDRIIPARYLKVVTFDGLGEALFYDERFDASGRPKPHPLNDPRHQGASLLVVGANFGCGSSREHAPQAIYRAGFRALIGESFAEIFFGNATTLSMPCVQVGREDLTKLAQRLEEDPDLRVLLDLEAMEVRLPGWSFPVRMPEMARQALVSGHWDPIADLLEAGELLEAFDARLPKPERRL